MRRGVKGRTLIIFQDYWCSLESSVFLIRPIASQSVRDRGVKGRVCWKVFSLLKLRWSSRALMLH